MAETKSYDLPPVPHIHTAVHFISCKSISLFNGEENTHNNTYLYVFFLGSNYVQSTSLMDFIESSLFTVTTAKLHWQKISIFKKAKIGTELSTWCWSNWWNFRWLWKKVLFIGRICLPMRVNCRSVFILQKKNQSLSSLAIFEFQNILSWRSSTHLVAPTLHLALLRVACYWPRFFSGALNVHSIPAWKYGISNGVDLIWS